MSPSETRELSAAIFGNEKWANVALLLESESLGINPHATAIAKRLATTSDLVMAVLVRMEAGGLVKAHPRIGSSRRGTIPWEVQRGQRWDEVIALCRQITSA
jgi:hypothetical protein